jgi:hypothetical protein
MTVRRGLQRAMNQERVVWVVLNNLKYVFARVVHLQRLKLDAFPVATVLAGRPTPGQSVAGHTVYSPSWNRGAEP